MLAEPWDSGPWPVKLKPKWTWHCRHPRTTHAQPFGPGSPLDSHPSHFQLLHQELSDLNLKRRSEYTRIFNALNHDEQKRKQNDEEVCAQWLQHRLLQPIHTLNLAGLDKKRVFSAHYWAQAPMRCPTQPSTLVPCEQLQPNCWWRLAGRYGVVGGRWGHSEGWKPHKVGGKCPRNRDSGRPARFTAIFRRRGPGGEVAVLSSSSSRLLPVC